MNIVENVEIAMSMSDIDKKTREERALDLLRMVGLDAYSKKYPNQLSGGQKQRVAIARALANNPTVILADEPTGALDSDSAETVMQILRKIAESGKLVIIVTHSQRVAEKCGRIIKMEDGVIVDDRKGANIRIDKGRDREIKPKSAKLKDLWKLSFRNVKQNKSRSLLTAIGLAIGLAAVLIILCLSAGLTNYVNEIYGSTLQSTQLIVSQSSDKKFSDRTIETIRELEGIGSLTETYTSTNAHMQGVGELASLGAYYEGAFMPDMLFGTVKADENDTRYIVVNEQLASAIGDGTPIAAIGQTVSVSTDRSVSFEVSGIYAEAFYTASGYRAYIGDAGMKAVEGKSELTANTLYIDAEDVTYISALSSDLSAMGFNVLRSTNAADPVLDYLDIGTDVLTAVSAISMVVSAIMIFIVLYISVTERMKEIGILRAIGARKRDIRMLFIFEAGLLGLIGGLLAVGACLLISFVTNMICLSTLEYSLISYNVLYYFLGIAVAVAVSVLAGVAPAYRASDLDPVEALRAE